MRSKLFLFPLIFSICVLFSCHKEGNTLQTLIVGKWTLQQQHAVLYIDNVKVIDTVYNASSYAYADVQFNSNGTFSTSSRYLPTALSQNLGTVPNTMNGNGTFSISGNVLTMKPGVAGWFTYPIGTSSLPTNSSFTLQENQLTSSKLSLHTTSSFTFTNSGGSHTYNEADDYYYTK